MYLFIHPSVHPSMHSFIINWQTIMLSNQTLCPETSYLYASVIKGKKTGNCCWQKSHGLNSTSHLQQPHFTIHRMLQWSVFSNTLSEMRYKQLQHEHNCTKYARTICATPYNNNIHGYSNRKANTTYSQPFVGFCDVTSLSHRLLLVF